MNDLSFGAVGAALIAAVVSIVGLILGKEQKTSEFRQAWIDALRTEIVTFLTQAAAVRDKLGVSYASHDAKVNALGVHYTELNRASHGIKLRLNADEEPSIEVLTAISEFEGLFAQDRRVQTSELDSIESRMLAASQNLLKSEWKRVKKGEFAYWFSKYVAVVLALVLAGLLVYYLAFGKAQRLDESTTTVKIEHTGSGAHYPITVLTP